MPDHEIWLPQFDESFVKPLRERGIDVRIASSDEPPCADRDCFARLATKYGVNTVVAPSALLESQSPPTYHLTVTSFDRAAGRVVVVAGQTSRGGEAKAVKALGSIASAIEVRMAPPPSATPAPSETRARPVESTTPPPPLRMQSPAPSSLPARADEVSHGLSPRTGEAMRVIVGALDNGDVH